MGAKRTHSDTVQAQVSAAPGGRRPLRPPAGLGTAEPAGLLAEPQPRSKHLALLCVPRGLNKLVRSRPVSVSNGEWSRRDRGT